MSHTPGPWKLDDRSESLVGANGERVIVWGCGLGFGQRTEETESNSRLIAKAPEMLEALKDVVNTFGWVDGEVRTETAKRVIAVIRAAEGK